jgi:hypothetical protein
MKKLLITALLGLASVALISIDAKAVPTPAIGDLILGFRVTDASGMGNTQNLEVDLGNVSNFTSLAAGTTVTLNATTPTSTGLSSTGPTNDLSSIYGANWNTRTDLVWGVAAASGRAGSSAVPGFPLSEVWGTSAELPAGTPGVTYISKGRTSQNAFSAAYENLVANSPGDPASLFETGLGTANSANSANETAATAGSWTASELNQGVNSILEFSFFNGRPMDAFTYGGDGVNTSTTPTTSIADLYELNPQATSTGTAPAILIGQFRLTQAGVFTYTATPVPEPSSIGLMGVGFLSLVGMVVLRRRRSVVA